LTGLETAEFKRTGGMTGYSDWEGLDRMLQIIKAHLDAQLRCDFPVFLLRLPVREATPNQLDLARAPNEKLPIALARCEVQPR
jgi:hypothetical protein